MNPQIQSSSHTLEKEGDGRYAVILGDNSRAGLVLGGNGRWLGESVDGCAMGSWLTRKSAAQAVADDAQDPLWDAMWAIAHHTGMPRADRQSDLRIDRRTLRAWRGKSDFLWILTPGGTHTLALEPPLRRDDLLKQVDPNVPGMQAYLVRSGSRPGGITRVRRGHLARMLSML